MCTTTGWTWDHVEHHTCLHRLAALQRQWRRSPPLQAMVQSWLGIEGEPLAARVDHQPAPLTPADEERAIADFARMFAAAGGTVH